MLELKANQILRLPVRLVDEAGEPLASVNFATVTVTVEKADGTLVDFNPNGSQWVEITQTAFAASGKYTLVAPATLFNQVGLLTYAVAHSGARTYLGTVKLIANEEAETKAVVDTLGSNITTILNRTTDLLDYQQGKWEIKVTGVDANRLILYRADGVTVLKKFDLANSNGDPTFINPFKRTPVP